MTLCVLQIMLGTLFAHIYSNMIRNEFPCIQRLILERRFMKMTFHKSLLKLFSNGRWQDFLTEIITSFRKNPMRIPKESQG